MHTSTVSTADQSLLQPFLQTKYVVLADSEEIVVHVGATHPALDARLQQADWAIITARNPAAEQLDTETNRARDNALAREIRRQGLSSFPSINHDPNGQWPDEPGFCIAGIDDQDAVELAGHFGQLALVHGRSARPAKLWLLGCNWPAILPDHVRSMAS